MAKSVRSSTRKRNSAKLRSTVFGPAADARTARLSAKLQEIVARPRETNNASKESSDEAEEKKLQDDAANQMAIDEEQTDKPKSKKGRSNRVKKQIRRKPRNTIAFSKPRRGSTRKN